MTIAQSSTPLTLPDHTQLPDSDGTFVFAKRAGGSQNFQEHPQSVLLTTSIRPVLDQLHADGQYCIGQDSGIYWRLTDPPERGAEAPDWFYVPNVPPMLDGQPRRSYVMWKEIVAPLIAIEFVSGDGSEERDRSSPLTGEGAKAGKFWVYEQAIRIPFYAIYEVEKESVELYELVGNQYQPVPANPRGHFEVAPMGVELGIWPGQYGNETLPWLRWWDLNGNLIPTPEERVEQEKQRVEQEKQRAEQEKQRADRLAERLRQLGVDPEKIGDE